MTNLRFTRLRQRLTTSGMDGLLVSNFYNILYLTGFKTLTTDEREAFVLATPKNLYLFSDARYLNKDSKLKNQDQKLRIKILGAGNTLISYIKEIINEEKINTLGFEAEDIRYYEYANLKNSLTKVILKPVINLIIRERQTKDSGEIEKIRQSCLLTGACLREVVKTIRAGDHEKDVAYRIEHWIKTNGFELAFNPIVAADKNSAIAHYNTKTGNGKLTDKSIVLIDFGIKYQDYISDITRMVFVGRPDTAVEKVYNQLLRAQGKTILEINKTKDPVAVDSFCREELKKTGLPDYSHSTGHGVGLEIHEYPKLSLTSRDRLADGQTVTVEPGIYFDGRFGMRIEDTISINKGQAEVLTTSDKEILIIKP